MSVGLRVVRGPDWSHGNADHGEGHMGTVIKDDTDNYDVIWDKGGKSNCRTGKDGKYDLRILDNAPIGVKHTGVNCSNCKKVIQGMRWRCTQCPDIDLCSQCYFTSQHNLDHVFQRMDKSGGTWVTVTKRSAETKIRAMGIFPGAKVQRGAHWEFGDQDGGIGARGTVVDIRPYGSAVGTRNAVKVKWPNNESNVYRVGSQGKVDVKCVEDAQGFYYYRGHLPVAGAKADTGAKSKVPISPPRKTPSTSKFNVGDKVCVHLPPESLKEVQRGHGGWSMRMSECIGETMRVKRIIDDSTVEVEHNGTTWQFYKGALSKVDTFNINDTVRVLGDKRKVELMQRNHGGWDDQMDKALNKVGRVVKIDSDGDVAVAFGQHTWVFNPACLLSAPGAKTETLKVQEDFSTSRSSATSAADMSDGMTRMIAHLLVLDALASRAVGPEQIVTAAARGDLSAVKNLLGKNKDLANCTFKNLTPLMISAHEGHEDVVKLLVDNGAKVNATNPENTTALLSAIAGKKEAVAAYLVQKGANVNVANMHGRSTAHTAAYEGMNNILKMVLEKGCNPNNRDSDGDTPLHDAIMKRNDRGVNLLLSHPKLDHKVTNQRGFNPLQWAAFKGNEFATERILAKAPGIVDIRKTDGHSALHIAAINNHSEIANLLILKGKATVDIKNKGDLTPLHLAAHQGYLETVQVLLQHGASVTVTDDDGDTPLHLALGGRRDGTADPLLTLLGISRIANTQEDNERCKVACKLIEKGGNPQARNNRNRTPLEVCRSDRVKEAVSNFAAKMRPQTAQRTLGDQLLEELFSELPLPCALCKERLADARFLPCRHKVSCKNCCLKFRCCPMCKQNVAKCVDLEGRQIVDVPCHVQ
ncbi:E3 ubiquitin-protein ligase MIB2-like [Pecten maximus]|uniref:E3 ubiquitin-protein ligase MIB2-like n=1 Tax=Pecten maximus TaxID=6579 RepID=UPI001459054D|nr:E3 ubiquitin-protein ligase MIB2-like [Pecten maximus]